MTVTKEQKEAAQTAGIVEDARSNTAMLHLYSHVDLGRTITTLADQRDEAVRLLRDDDAGDYCLAAARPDLECRHTQRPCWFHRRRAFLARIEGKEPTP